MCGLFGYVDYGHVISARQINDLIDALATESAARGTDATGIAYIVDGKLEIEKEAKSAYEITFRVPRGTRAVIGHTRHSTQGSCKKRYNNHPFRGRLKDGSVFALAHNGIIGNDKDLRKKHKLPETQVETDSYIAVQLLEREKELSFTTIKDMVEVLRGTFSFTILDDSINIYIIRGDNPLSVLHFTALGLYCFASTEQLLWRALSSSMLAELKSGMYEEVQITEGQILRISPNGQLDWGEFENLSFSMSGQYDWWDYGIDRLRKPAIDEDTGYIDELWSVAGSFGYSRDDIDYMLHRGYTPEEIEEILYGYGDDIAYTLANR
jgi:glucosamine 6-phosphate synthetase-like amidotransferase/phosphosugar isomerase protein